jgi:predicted CxxxxCH...CXXCH cytochrome family protein
VGSSGISCEKCHIETTASTNPNPATMTLINSTNGGLHLNGIENVVFKDIGGQTGTYDPGTGVCSATYCHGGSSPFWGNAAAGLTCEGCHQSQGPDSGTFTGAHQRHTDVASNYNLSCENCHALLDSTTNRQHTGGPFVDPQIVEIEFTDASGTHLQGGGAELYRYMNIDNNPHVGAPATPTYTNSGVSAGTDSVNSGITWTAGTCSTVWCHSNANPIVGPGSSTTHTVHVDDPSYDFKCLECHADTVTTAVEDITSAGGFSNHVDGEKDVVFDGSGISAGGTWTSPTCTVYCHSDGAGGPAVQTPNWTQANTGDCGDCHGANNVTAPASTPHGTHVLSANGYQFACVRCHTGIVTDTASSAVLPDLVNNSIHVNGFPNAVINGSGPLGGGSFDDATNTCSTTYCHGNGAGGAGIETPDWDDVATGDCGDCHGVSRATPPSSLVHKRHVANLTTISPNQDDGYLFACEKCHTTIVSFTINSTVPPQLLDNSVHVNGVRNAILNGVDPLINNGLADWNGSNCSNLYCHGADMPNQSNGDGTSDGNLTPAWPDPGLEQCHPEGRERQHDRLRPLLLLLPRLPAQGLRRLARGHGEQRRKPLQRLPRLSVRCR